MGEQPVDRTIDLTSLKGLAHPLRVQLLDALSTYGPATASGLADRLGESSGATSYHLRQLEKNGFVREDTTRGNARERWWERVPGGITLDVSGLHPASAERAAGELVLAEWQRNRDRLLRDFLNRGEETVGLDWVTASAIQTTDLRLTRAQLQELNDEMLAIAGRYAERSRGQDVPGSRPVQLQINAFPVVDGDEVPGG